MNFLAEMPPILAAENLVKVKSNGQRSLTSDFLQKTQTFFILFEHPTDILHGTLEMEKINEQKNNL